MCLNGWSINRFRLSIDIKGLKHFRKKDKLAPKFVGPFPIFKCVRKVAYKLELPEKLLVIHLVLNISMLRKHVKNDGKHVVPDVTNFEVRVDTSIDVKLVGILEKRERKLRNMVILIVNVQ